MSECTKEKQIKKKHEFACVKCTKGHQRCDKKYPSCTHCLSMKIPCEIRYPLKKRGRPVGTTKTMLYKRKKEAEKEAKMLELENNNDLLNENSNDIDNIVVQLHDPLQFHPILYTPLSCISLHDQSQPMTKEGDQDSFVFERLPETVLEVNDGYLLDLEFDNFKTFTVSRVI